MFKVTIKVVGVGIDSGNILESRQIMQRIRMAVQEMFSSNLGQNSKFVFEDSKISEEEAWAVISLKSSDHKKNLPKQNKKS